ncbi:MAG: guanylate kinase [Microbacteriaceae bacterium]
MKRLAVIAGPTAVGKGTVVRYLLQNFENLHLSVSATTRAPRPGERNGVDYFFLSREEFERLIEAGEMLEYATVHGEHLYGTPRKPVEDALRLGQQVILEIDLQGARQVKTQMPEALTIFIAPPSWEELVRRLSSRGTESADQQQKRLETAKVELDAADEFDAIVVNDDIAKCAHEVLDLLQA